MVRVVLVGDSQLTDTSPRAVTKLGPRLRRRGYEVETLAIGGLDTRTALTSLPTTSLSDWTVFCFGANDSAPWKRVPPAEFSSNYETLIRRANCTSTLVLGPAPVAESGLPGSRTNRDVALYSAIAAHVARSCDAGFIPLYDVLCASDLSDDGVHLNDHGYDTIERLVTEAIEPARPSATDNR